MAQNYYPRTLKPQLNFKEPFGKLWWNIKFYRDPQKFYEAQNQLRRPPLTRDDLRELLVRRWNQNIESFTILWVSCIMT